MEDNKEFIDEHVELFRAEITRALEIAKVPEDLRWAVFSTGSREIEEQVLDLIVSKFLTKIDGVFIFRTEDPIILEKNLEQALAELRKSNKEAMLTTASADESEYVLTFGDSND